MVVVVGVAALIGAVKCNGHKDQSTEFNLGQENNNRASSWSPARGRGGQEKEQEEEEEAEAEEHTKLAKEDLDGEASQVG